MSKREPDGYIPNTWREDLTKDNDVCVSKEDWGWCESSNAIPICLIAPVRLEQLEKIEAWAKVASGCLDNDIAIEGGSIIAKYIKELLA